MDRKPEKKFRIAIVGTGLIGCSMADGLRSVAKEITGVDNNTSHLQEALSRGLIDRCMSLEKAVHHSDLVIVAVPVDISVELIGTILDLAGPRSVVLDAGSVKGVICRSVDNHPKRAQFVAAHPMAGLAVSGPDAADALLFRNRKVLICEQEKSSARALEIASMVFNRLGMNIIYMSPENHDMSVARVSHLPQVIAYCLSLLDEGRAGENEPLTGIASTGFESLTRLASSPANMWVPIFRHNNEELSAGLVEMIELLSDIRKMMENDRWEQLTQLIGKANRIREDFITGYK
jgi:prephenate dehydrogenase